MDYQFSEHDHNYMRKALDLAERGMHTAPPNPHVGCVIVREDQIIAEGFHVRKGQWHAERNAILNCSEPELLRGSTLYCTLEPCCHHGSTPPCTDIIIEYGIKKVILAVADSDSKVDGKGIDQLKRAGIEVLRGCLEKDVKRSLRAYLHHRTSFTPYVVGKIASSLNGKICCEDGTSKWITGPEAREDAHGIRARSQAVIVGVGTALTDDPQLTVRLPEPFQGPQPTRVVLDPQGKLLEKMRKGERMNLFDTSVAPSIIVTLQGKSRQPRPTVGEVEVLEIGGEDRSLDLQELLSVLGKRGMHQVVLDFKVMVEGGAVTLSRFSQRGLLNELTLYQAPTVLGERGTGWWQSEEPTSMAERKEWKVEELKMVGKDIKIEMNSRSRVLYSSSRLGPPPLLSLPSPERLSEEEIQFSWRCIAPDGRLTLNRTREFMQLSLLECKDLMLALDRDGDGRVGKADFLSFMSAQFLEDSAKDQVLWRNAKLFGFEAEREETKNSEKTKEVTRAPSRMKVKEMRDPVEWSRITDHIESVVHKYECKLLKDLKECEKGVLVKPLFAFMNMLGEEEQEEGGETWLEPPEEDEEDEAAENRRAEQLMENRKARRVQKLRSTRSRLHFIRDGVGSKDLDDLFLSEEKFFLLASKAYDMAAVTRMGKLTPEDAEAVLRKAQGERVGGEGEERTKGVGVEEWMKIVGSAE